jgi:hypothetical protein
MYILKIGAPGNPLIFHSMISHVYRVWLTFGEGGSKALEFAASLSLAAPSR